MRIGYGWDSHEFQRGLPLKIGGVALEHDRGLAGHSDGDVLLHALTDALLGAVAAGDIGQYFPPGDPKWKGADSAIFVREALKQVKRAGYRIANVDSTIILQAPKIGPHAKQIQQRVAELLGIAPGDVGIKAKTPEGMGTDNAAIAHVTVLLVRRRSGRERALQLAEEAMPQDVVDQVVERTLQSAEPRKRRAKVKS
ncbi:MAG: 2-C-methyl-D-erythritol 2,4-cyclodiphosphate synthase [Terriglobales bacterium]